MIYKLYKKYNSDFVVLVSPNVIGEWYFDAIEFKENISLKEWKESLEWVAIFIKTAIDNRIKFTSVDINFDDFHKTVDEFDELESIFDVFLELGELEKNEGISLEFKGECVINQEEVAICELLGVKIRRDNAISISVFTRNLCYLPCNPVTKDKQYELWKNNSPMLAMTLEQFKDLISVDLIMEEGEYWRSGGVFCKEHPFYLMNAVINGKKEPEDLDEFYIPFHMISIS